MEHKVFRGDSKPLLCRHLNVYSHVLPDDFDNLAAAMDTAARAAAS